MDNITTYKHVIRNTNNQDVMVVEVNCGIKYDVSITMGSCSVVMPMNTFCSLVVWGQSVVANEAPWAIEEHE